MIRNVIIVFKSIINMSIIKNLKVFGENIINPFAYRIAYIKSIESSLRSL